MDVKAKLEYIWLDGYEPTQSMRSKTMIRSNFGGTVEECPMWSFDGSSTLQAEGGDNFEQTFSNNIQPTQIEVSDEEHEDDEDDD